MLARRLRRRRKVRASRRAHITSCCCCCDAAAVAPVGALRAGGRLSGAISAFRPDRAAGSGEPADGVCSFLSPSAPPRRAASRRLAVAHSRWRLGSLPASAASPGGSVDGAATAKLAPGALADAPPEPWYGKARTASSAATVADVSAVRRLMRAQFLESSVLRRRVDALESGSGDGKGKTGRPSAAGEASVSGSVDCAVAALVRSKGAPAEDAAAAAALAGVASEVPSARARVAVRAELRGGRDSLQLEAEAPLDEALDEAMQAARPRRGAATATATPPSPPLSLSKLLYLSSVGPARLAVSPLGCEGADVFATLNPMGAVGLSKFSAEGNPLLAKVGGAGLGASVEAMDQALTASAVVCTGPLTKAGSGVSRAAGGEAGGVGVAAGQLMLRPGSRTAIAITATAEARPSGALSGDPRIDGSVSAQGAQGGRRGDGAAGVRVRMAPAAASEDKAVDVALLCGDRNGQRATDSAAVVAPLQLPGVPPSATSVSAAASFGLAIDNVCTLAGWAAAHDVTSGLGSAATALMSPRQYALMMMPPPGGSGGWGLLAGHVARGPSPSSEGFVAEAFMRLSTADRRLSVIPGVVYVRPGGYNSGVNGTTALVCKTRITFG